MSGDPDIDKLVDDILERCVEGYQRPPPKAKSKPKLLKVRDGFEMEDGANSPGRST
jgi:hypothetical protein